MNDSIIVYAISLICIILLLIEWIFISHKKCSINAIVFVGYSFPLYYLMSYKGACGVALLLHGADNAYAGAKQMWTGNSQTTCTYAGTKYASQKLGASEETADKIATTVDVGTSFVGGSSGLYKSNRFVTGRLQKHVNQAVKEVDSEGLKALTQKQLRTVQKNSRLYPAYRGNRIDVRTRQKV